MCGLDEVFGQDDVLAEVFLSEFCYAGADSGGECCWGRCGMVGKYAGLQRLYAHVEVI